METRILNDYVCFKRVANTLQGQTILAMNKKTKKLVVIKTASRKLHKYNVAMNGEYIQENILREAHILQSLSKKISNSSNNCGFVEFERFVKDSENYYLIEEYGGIDLYEFTDQQHFFVKHGKLSLKQWQLQIQYLIGLVINTVRFFHHECSLTHLDLSLENIVINPNTMNIKICDFGLSLFFENEQKSFICNQYAGKTLYKSPEIIEKKPFDARLADVWAIGIMLFILLTGIPPFEIASSTNARFQYIFNGNFNRFLKLCNLEDYVPKDAKDLLIRIFKPETKRITIEQMLSHPYVSKCNKLIIDSQKNDLENKEKHWKSLWQLAISQPSQITTIKTSSSLFLNTTTKSTSKPKSSGSQLPIISTLSPIATSKTLSISLSSPMSSSLPLTSSMSNISDYNFQISD